MKKIIVIGNVGQDPEMKTNKNNEQYTSFSIAVKGKTPNQKDEWMDIVCNNRLAETACQFLKKGSKILVEGSPIIHSYTNKQNENVNVFKVYASYIEFL